MGYINKKDWEILETSNPEKLQNLYGCIFKYMAEEKINEREYSTIFTAYNKTDIKISDQIYAKNIEIVSSGNEPKIYAYVNDNNNNVIFGAGLLDTSPEAYAKVAKIAGFFLEKFNLYIDINFNFK